MAQPTPYVPATNFEDFQASNPTDPLPADDIDGEFAAIRATIDQTLANLALIQRDDGALANQTVRLETLSAVVVALLGSPLSPRGAWTTAATYQALDLVSESGATYVCVVAHTAGVFATDAAAGKWMLFSNPIPDASAVESIVDDALDGVLVIGPLLLR